MRLGCCSVGHVLLWNITVGVQLGHARRLVVLIIQHPLRVHLCISPGLGGIRLKTMIGLCRCEPSSVICGQIKIGRGICQDICFKSIRLDKCKRLHTSRLDVSVFSVIRMKRGSLCPR